MKEKRIHFIVADINVTGGVEKVTKVLAEEFSKMSYHVSVHSLYSNNIKTEGNFTHIAYGLTPPDLKRNKFLKAITTIFNGLEFRRRISKLEDKENLIFQGFYLSTYLPFVPRKYPRIVCEHNTFSAPGKVSRIVRKLLYTLWEPMVVVLTEKDKKYFQALGCRDVHKIYNPSPFKIKNKEFQHKGGNLISLGRFTFQKRFELMVEIMLPILSKRHSWKLIIQGGGPESDKIHRIVEATGARDLVEIRGEGNPEQIYSEGSIFLMTSLFEGLPMTIIEALSLGIPVIAFNCSPGIDELIAPGKNGFLIDMNDLKEFQDKVLYLMDNPRTLKEMSIQANESARKFLISEIITEWQKVLK